MMDKKNAKLKCYSIYMHIYEGWPNKSWTVLAVLNYLQFNTKTKSSNLQVYYITYYGYALKISEEYT